MKIKKILSFLTLCIVAFSCKKNTTTTLPPAAVPYMSVTVNSTWQYQFTDNITAKTNNYILTSTNRDTSIGSKMYHVFTNSAAGLSEYYNVSGADYYNYRSLSANLGNSKLEILYLKDNQTEGSTWQQTSTLDVSGLTIPVTINNKIEEKGISRSVNGITYQDVIHVSSTISSDAIPSAKLVTDIHNYYAPKVGVIESTYKVMLNYIIISNIDTKSILLSSDIK